VMGMHRWLSAAVLALAVLVTWPDSGNAQGPEVERWLDSSNPFSLGVDTTRFRVSSLGTRPVITTEDPALTSAPYRLIDSDLLGTAVTFDLKLRWPLFSGSGSSLPSLAPYLSFGPTVLVPSAEGVSRPGPPGKSEGPMAFGLSWGAGLSWRFSRSAELFGGYRFMQFGRENLSHGERPETELTGHDVMYGISVRF